MIYPATQKHIDKYRKQDVEVVEETADDYKNITLPFLKGENKFSVQVIDFKYGFWKLCVQKLFCYHYYYADGRFAYKYYQPLLSL